VNPDKPTPATASTLLDNASPWVRQAYEASLSCDPRRAVADVKILAALLRKRPLHLSRKIPKTVLSAGGVEWNAPGDVQFFDLDAKREVIEKLGRSQGWNVTVVKCRKEGKLRAMAISRRPIK